MPHISNQKLDARMYRTLFSQLSRVLVDTTHARADRVLMELMTETERIMLAKRLATALMFHQHCSQYRVAQTLKLSSSTVKRMYHIYRKGGFDTIIAICEKRKIDRERFLSILEVIVRGGMPSRGKRRWASLATK